MARSMDDDRNVPARARAHIERRERLAAELRENLKKRKAQARARGANVDKRNAREDAGDGQGGRS